MVGGAVAPLCPFLRPPLHYIAPMLPSGPPSTFFLSTLTNKVITAKEKTRQAQHEDKRVS